VPDLPIVLREEREIVGTVLVVVNAAAAETEVGSAEQEFLPVGEFGRIRGTKDCSVHKEELAIENLREEFIEVNARVLTAKAEDVSAFDPTDGVGEIECVLILELVGGWSRTDLKTRAAESELING